MVSKNELKKLKVPELKKACRDAGLDDTGVRKTLLARLYAHNSIPPSRMEGVVEANGVVAPNDHPVRPPVGIAAAGPMAELITVCGLAPATLLDLEEAGFTNLDKLLRLHQSKSYPKDLEFIKLPADRNEIQIFISQRASLAVSDLRQLLRSRNSNAGSAQANVPVAITTNAPHGTDHPQPVPSTSAAGSNRGRARSRGYSANRSHHHYGRQQSTTAHSDSQQL
ncbi:uncharacterized protein LOC129584997 [Paramacrobiotus metropolitanus]|uniref:uncharacterized protein LOC129584997 n=1 Tax=Paramacrobiotus metropolitanus TaxID=2943436 RepID=UPI0024465536|nr:uncharacterized protein LOC129584997 [Paramacrobiotus metropolitanus]